jgi:hypothetical protein
MGNLDQIDEYVNSGFFPGQPPNDRSLRGRMPRHPSLSLSPTRNYDVEC